MTRFNRVFIIVILVLTVIFTLFTLSETIAKDKKNKRVILSTVDIGEDYEILGLVHYKSNELATKKIDKELRKQAAKIGADYVVGIIYYTHSGYLYGSGTAVKVVEKDDSN